MLMHTTATSEETARLGAKLARQLKGGEVICLSGPLGSGKSTFVTGFIHHFLPHVRVLSPTFTLVRQYQVQHSKIKHVYHLDLYRLKEKEKIANLGLGDHTNRPDSVVLIEWPEKLQDILRYKLMEISFFIANDTERVVTFKGLRNYRATVSGSNAA